MDLLDQTEHDNIYFQCSVIVQKRSWFNNILHNFGELEICAYPVKQWLNILAYNENNIFENVLSLSIRDDFHFEVLNTVSGEYQVLFDHRGSSWTLQFQREDALLFCTYLLLGICKTQVGDKKPRSCVFTKSNFRSLEDGDTVALYVKRWSLIGYNLSQEFDTYTSSTELGPDLAEIYPGLQSGASKGDQIIVVHPNQYVFLLEIIKVGINLTL
eukprot:TRINITY_DN3541_c0_g2_i1.p1 TRINITY_DN3541_c0_g2~~TRINITY_DN3541_c0_g2_i1.p1  ORF type:complete len:214 (+),score=26.39 TRINITY_DN3541_c0_g2_i1:17-658(+)